MKHWILLWALISMVSNVRSQGINFSKQASWNNVLRQAKTENKFVFVDGYATWCKPCRMMDADVYSDPAIGQLMNEKFISIKLQIDQRAEDDDYIKSWYNDATMLSQKYKLNALPALLFFSPQGELLYSEDGYHNVKKFAGLARFATDPQSQVFRPKVKDYLNGTKNYTELPALIKTVLNVLKDNNLAVEMIKDYFDNYVDKLENTEDVLTRDNLELASMYLWGIKPSNKFVKEMKKSSVNVSDSLLQQAGATKNFLTEIVKRDELDWRLCKNGKIANRRPDWDKLEKEITNKYPQVNVHEAIKSFQVSGSVLNEKGFFYRVKNWAALNNYYTKEIEEKLNKGDLEGVNNICWWEYFCRVTDVKSLKLARSWIDKAINRSIQNKDMSAGDKAIYIDTKAALLYKAGQRQEAIKTEESAIEIVQAENKQKGLSIDKGCKSFYAVIEKMKKGEQLQDGYRPVEYPADWRLLD